MGWVSVKVNIHRKEGFVEFKVEGRKKGRRDLIENFRLLTPFIPFH